MCPKITKTPPKLLQNCKNPGFLFLIACHFRNFFLIRARLRFFCEFSKILGQGKLVVTPLGGLELPQLEQHAVEHAVDLLQAHLGADGVACRGQ